MNNAPILNGLDADGAVMRKGSGPVRLDTGANAIVTDADNNGFVVQRVGTGFTGGVLDLAPVPDGSGRVFVVEKNGRVSILDPSSGSKILFLNVGSQISTASEDGLLGFAAAPDYATSGRFYVYLTNTAGNNEVRSYLRSASDPNVADAASGDLLLSIPHPGFSNHNGGWLAFGPDGMLYIATGDGGGAGDPNRNAQNTQSLLGKMLRIDVSQDSFPNDPARDYAIPAGNPFASGGGRAEIWAVGLRNPFRNSFDSATGDLYIGDVGQGAREEIDIMRAGVGGANFGWSIREGTLNYNGGSTAGLTAPVAEYGHGNGAREGRSVTGGYVYNGPAESLKGKYFFGDFVSANIFAIPTGQLTIGATLSSSSFELFKTGFTPDMGRINQISSFGVDAANNLYILDFSDGEVFRVGASRETNFGAGRLTVAISAGKVAGQDQLLIDTAAGSGVALSSGTAAGSEVRVGGVLIGFVASGAGGSGGQDLAIDFTSAATPARVATLLRALTYGNSAGANATEGARTITYTLNDGAGTAGGGASNVIATSQVNVVAAAGPASGLFDYSDGGDDVAVGSAGDDGFYFGAALNAADEVDGGAGTLDQVGLQGDYPGLTLGPKNLVNIEQLVLLPGDDARFGDTSGALYSYTLTTVDANVAAGQRLVVTFNTLRPGENVSFNGAAETDGFFLTYGGRGIDLLTGSQGDDGFFFGAEQRFGAFDAVDGQGGVDQLGLQGAYAGANAIVFGESQLQGIEFVVALSGGDARFGSGGLGYSYDLTTSDGNVAGGAMLVVSANTLRSDETLTFDGSAETNGRFRIFAGAGADDITGGDGADEISGGRGADVLEGGAGADVFVYAAAADSTSTNFDRIVNFDYTVDKIDLPTTVGNFSDAITGTLSLATFDADLAAALAGVLGPGEAAAFQASGGDMIGRIFGIVDADGVAGYQPGEDYVVEFVTPVTPPDPTIDFLI